MVMSAAEGTVITQAINIFPRRLKRTLRIPVEKPAPTMAPVAACVVLTGNPRADAASTTLATE